MKAHINSFNEATQAIEQITQNMIVKFYNTQPTHKEIEEIVHRLKNETFEVMVVGEFNSGKSTFVNALMERSIMPSSSDPTTAVLTKVQYGQETYELTYKKGNKSIITPEEFSCFIAPKMIDEVENKSKETKKLKKELKSLEHITIHYPAPFLKSGITLIDSPGTNDPEIEREIITNSYIPKSEAVLFVLDAGQSLSQTELTFLKSILNEDIHKIFFVINKADKVKDDIERDEIVEHLTKTLKENDIEYIRHLFVCARAALFNYEKRNGISISRRQERWLQKVGETGMQELKEELTYFLLAEKGMIKLQRAISQVQQIINKTIQQDLEVELHSLDQSVEVIGNRKKNIDTEMKKVRKEWSNAERKSSNALKAAFREIVTWHKGEADKIGNIALTTFDKLVQKKEYTEEELNNEIEASVVILEKELYELLREKVMHAIKENIQMNFQEIEASFEVVHLEFEELIKSDNTKSLSVNLEQWGSADYKLGGGVIAGVLAASVFGAGIVAVGASAWLGAKLVSFFVDDEEEEKKKRTRLLREEVKKKYISSINNNARKLDKALSMIQEEVLNELKQYIHKEIEQNSLRIDKLMRNAVLEEDEVRDKRYEIQEEIHMLKGAYLELTEVLQIYRIKNKVKGVQVDG